jgi:transcriptional regulator with XRE-family HTH domain
MGRGASLKTLRSRGHRALLDVLIEARKREGLTQQQLAERLGKPQSYVAKIEAAERGIDPIECRDWARACGMTPRAFWYRLELRFERTPSAVSK